MRQSGKFQYWVFDYIKELLLMHLGMIALLFFSFILKYIPKCRHMLNYLW